MRKVKLNLLGVSAIVHVFACLKYEIEIGKLPDGTRNRLVAFIASDREG